MDKLANEMLMEILSNLDDKRDMMNCALVQHRFLYGSRQKLHHTLRVVETLPNFTDTLFERGHHGTPSDVATELQRRYPDVRHCICRLCFHRIVLQERDLHGLEKLLVQLPRLKTMVFQGADIRVIHLDSDLDDLSRTRDSASMEVYSLTTMQDMPWQPGLYPP